MKVSTTGYKRNSKDKKHKQLYIPGDILTMLGVDDYVQATPQYPDGSLGKTTTMAPGVPRISFPGAVGVIEKKLPKAQLGVPYYDNSKYQNLTNRELDALPLAEQDAIYRNEYMTRYNIGANAVDDVLGSSKDVLYSYNGTIPYKTNPDEFLPAGVAFKGEFPAVRVPSGVQYSADHIDWDNYDPYLRDAYFRSVDKVKDWNKQWYTGRATLPQFKDVAEKRLAQLLDIDIQPYGSEEEYLEKFPESGGQFRPFMNDIILPPSSFRNPSLINHELSHLLDYNVPQTPGGLPFPSYNSNDPVLNNIIPDEYKQPYGGLTNILNSIGNGEVIKASDKAGDKESITIPFADKSNVFSNGFLSPGKAPSEYYYKPTEIRARLNEWRFQNKIDPTKNYTEEEIQEIMDNDIKYNQKGSYDLYKLVRGRADLLKKIHDSQVSTGDKNTSDQLPQAQTGLSKYQVEGTVKPRIGIGLGYQQPSTGLGLNINYNPYANSFRPKVATAQSPAIDVRKVARPTAVAESTNRNVTHQIPTNTKELKAEADAQAAYDALPEAMKRQDVLTADTRSDTEKFARQAWTAISYPMATISAVNRGHDIPMGSLGMYSPYEGYDVGGPMNFLVDAIAGTPAFIVNAASRQGEQLVDDPLKYAYTMSLLGMLDPETQGQAISNTLDLSAVIPVARMTAGPLVKNTPAMLDEIMSTAAPKGNMYGQNQVLTQRARLLDPAVKRKFFANQAPEPEVPASMFTKSPKDLGNRITPENYEDFVNRIHGSTGYELAVAPKTGNNLGIGSYGNQGIVYRDAPLNNLGKDIINAHEKSHGIFAGTMSPEMETALLKPFGTRKPIPYYPDKHQADEVLARMGQFKNAVGIGDNQTFTLGHLNLIRKNYADQFIDNSIKEMLAKIKPGSASEREFLINMNKFAFGLTGAGLTGFGIYNAQPLEQPIEERQQGGQLHRMQVDGQVPDPTINNTAPEDSEEQKPFWSKGDPEETPEEKRRLKQFWEKFDISSPEGLKKKNAWDNYNASTEQWWDALKREQQNLGRDLTDKEKEKWIQDQARGSSKVMRGFKYNRDKDQRFEFLFNPEQYYDPGSGNMGFKMNTVVIDPKWTPQELEIQKAKKEFLADLNADPLQKALGQDASFKNPLTNAAATRYARWKVLGEQPGNKLDRWFRGNRAPSLRDFYEPTTISGAADFAGLLTAGAAASGGLAAGITALPIIGEAAYAAGAANPFIQATGAALTASPAALPGASLANLANAYFITHGIMSAPETYRAWDNAINNGGSYQNAIGKTLFNLIDFSGLGAVEGFQPAFKYMGEGFNTAVKYPGQLYNNVATGNSRLTDLGIRAWKSPAVGLSQEASADMFNSLLNSGKMTPVERNIVLEYQQNPSAFTGRRGPIDPVKRSALNDIIGKYELQFPQNSNVIATRRFNFERGTLGANMENGRINFGDRPTSFSAGLGLEGYQGAPDRLVIPSRYLPKMKNNFIAQEYSAIPKENLELIGQPSMTSREKLIDFGSGIGTSNEVIGTENELLGTGLDFKQIGKVKNDIGGFDYVVKPRSVASGTTATTEGTNVIQPKWVKPSKTQLTQEFRVEHQAKGSNYFASEEEFQKAVNEANIEEITPEMDLAIQNKSRHASREAMIESNKNYKSWPKYRNENTIDGIYEGMQSGAKMDMPIVLEFKDGTRRMFSGNTRMDVAFQSGKNPQALIVKVPEASAAGETLGAAGDIAPVPPEARYKKMMEFFTMPDSKSKSGQNMLAEFQQRIRTPEGQQRLKDLGITNPHIFEGLVLKEMQNELGYFNPNMGIEYLAIHKDMPEAIAAKITRHELEHAVQKALSRQAILDPDRPISGALLQKPGITEIDDILENLTFKGTPSETFTPRVTSDNPIPFPNNQELFPDAQRNLDYFVHGSQGKERSAFLGEVQQSLVENKLIDNVYQNITPQKVEEAYNLYMKDLSSDKYPLRLFEIIEPTQKNFQDISKGLNKMLGLTGVGIGIGAATQQKKKGGPVNKRNHKDLDNYFAQAWSKSRKTA